MKEESLYKKTKQFLDYIYESKCNLINLKKAAEKLKIPKRRIYDITNVLKGK